MPAGSSAAFQESIMDPVGSRYGDSRPSCLARVPIPCTSLELNWVHGVVGCVWLGLSICLIPRLWGNFAYKYGGRPRFRLAAALPNV